MTPSKEDSASYHRLLRSSWIIGGSSAGNILIGLARVKVLAVLLGPVGVGIFGLYQSLMGTAGTVAAMGIGTAGTKLVAETIAEDDAQSQTAARRALFWLGVVLACAGGLIVWALRGVLAAALFHDSQHTGAVGWLAVGVALWVLFEWQKALVQGMRRVGDLARLTVFSALVYTVAGSLIIWRFGEAGLTAYVVAGPLASCLLGSFYVSRLPRAPRYAFSWSTTTRLWRTLLTTGAAFMGALVANTLVQLWVRVAIQGHLGAEPLGHYQAAWTITTQYLDFILIAMAAEYFPRLSGVIGDKPAAARLVNEQTEIAVLISAPVIIAMLGLTPWIVTLLYSSAFAPADVVIRWQLIGDVFKVAGWPLGFVMISAGASRRYFLAQASSLALMGGLITGLTPLLGLKMAGIASLVSQVYYVPLVYWFAKRKIDFRWTGHMVRLLTVALVLSASMAALSTYTSWGVYVAICAALMFGFYSLGRVSYMSDLKGPIGRLGGWAHALTECPKGRRGSPPF